MVARLVHWTVSRSRMESMWTGGSSRTGRQEEARTLRVSREAASQNMNFFLYDGVGHRVHEKSGPFRLTSSCKKCVVPAGITLPVTRSIAGHPALHVDCLGDTDLHYARGGIGTGGVMSPRHDYSSLACLLFRLEVKYRLPPSV